MKHCEKEKKIIISAHIPFKQINEVGKKKEPRWELKQLSARLRRQGTMFCRPGFSKR